MKRALVLAVLCWPAALMAMTGQEVLVVANSESPESLELAKFYMEARQIPASNLLLVETATTYEVSRADYEKQIHKPLADFLRGIPAAAPGSKPATAAAPDPEKAQARARISCIVLMWGVPVRVAAGKADGNEAEEAIRVAAARAHYRLAMDYQLLGNVGRNFPTSMPADLLPVSKQFDVPKAPVKEPLDPVATVLKNFAGLLADKQMEVRKLTKPEQKALATRQIMALHADAYGMEGLLNYIKDWSPENAPKAEDVQKLIAEAQQRLGDVRRMPVTGETARVKAALMERIGGLALVTTLTPQAGDAAELADVAVDSDLALALWSNEDRQRCRLTVHSNAPQQSVPNVLNWQFASHAEKFPKVLLTARLDGPKASDAKKALEGALAAEKKGLSGTVYVDAGVKSVSGNANPMYAEFDGRLVALAKLLTAKTGLKVVLDEKEACFAEGTCPDAAVYAGWYSLRNYVPAFKWTPGAVGLHYASFEAMYLRDAKEGAWCNRMIEEGVSATAGAVKEPFLHAFPPPDEFFPLLLTGKYTLGECYWRTNPLANWRMTLIGDPLYNPFAAKPALKVEDLPKGLAP